MDWRGRSGKKRMNSDEALSSVTGDIDACGQIYPAQFQDQSIVWTNEKHNLYIKSLEATFVQQLHLSIGLSCRNLPPSTFDSSDKFTVPQDGCRKMLQPKSKLQMNTTNNKIRGKPRVRNFRSSGKDYGGTSLSLGMDCDHSARKTISRPEQLAGHYGSYHLSRSCAALAEFSDQNFIDEQQVTNLSSNEWLGEDYLSS